jgi:hypothetical protein
VSERIPDLGFAADYDAPIPYIERVRDYYRGRAVSLAHYAEVPFQPLKKPLAECRIAWKFCRVRRSAGDAPNSTGKKKLPNGFAMNRPLLEPVLVAGNNVPAPARPTREPPKACRCCDLRSSC